MRQISKFYRLYSSASHIDKALKLVNHIPSPFETFNKVGIALGISEEPSLEKIFDIVKKIDNKWDYDAHVKFNDVFLYNIRCVTKEFVLEYCKYINQLGKFFIHNKALATNVDFIKKLVENGAEIAHFMKTVNDINYSLRVDGKIDPELLEFQFTYLKNDKRSIGILGYLPENMKEQYISDNTFIEKYFTYFEKNDWKYIVSIRKDDKEFIKKYWSNIDHVHYFQQCNSFTYDAVKQVVNDGYINELTAETWILILYQIEKDNMLDELYNLCGSSIIFPEMIFEGNININVSYIPNIENISDITLSNIFNRSINDKPLCTVSSECSKILNEKLKQFKMNFNENASGTYTHVENMIVAIMATYIIPLSAKNINGFKITSQMQCSNTLKRIFPIYFNNQGYKTIESVVSSKY